MKFPSTALYFKTTAKQQQHLSYLTLLFLLLLGCSTQAQRSFLGTDGGFEGPATIINATTNASPVATNWTKSTTIATIAAETATVRSGSKSIKVSTTSTSCRVYSPAIPITASTTAWQVQYYRRSTNITNTVENQSAGYRTGTEQINGTYSSVSASNTWEKVTYSPSSTTSATTAAAGLLVRAKGTGGDTYYDDFVLYESATVDVTAPNSAGTVTISNVTGTTADVSWLAASGGVDGGGYMVVRYAANPNADNDPNVNGVYGVGNTITNGTGSLAGTVCYVGTATSFTDTGLSAGSYFYKVYTYDKAYNYATESQGSIATAIPTITSFSPVTVCAGGNLVITGTNFTGATSVTIGGVAAASYVVNSSTQITAVVGAGSSGSVSVSILGNTATLAGATVISTPGTPTITAGSSTTLCSGGSVVLTATAANSYLWSNGATTQSITVNSSGSYTVSVTNANGCTSSNSAATVVSASTSPVSPIAGSNSPTCVGSPLNLTASSVQIGGYTMSGNSGISFIDISATGTSIGTISDESETNITIPAFTFNGTSYTTARVGNNGMIVFGSTTGDVDYTNSALPNTLNTAGNVFLAPYWDDLNTVTGPATIKTQTVGNIFIMQYTAENQYDFPSGLITFQVQLNLLSGAIHFVYQDVLFGSATYDNGLTATIGIQMSGTSAIQYSHNTASITSGSSITFNPVLATYSWTGPNGFTSSVQNPTISAATAAANGVYTVVVTNPTTGCQSPAATTNIALNPALNTTPTITAGGPTTFCAGGSVVLTASAGNSYLWSTGATTQSITVTASGNYTVKTFSAFGCPSPSSAAVAVTVNPAPATPTITASGSTTICSGTSVTLTSSSASSYLWTTGETTQSITVSATDSYAVQVSDAIGCTSALSAATIVTVLSTPAAPTATNTQSFCNSAKVSNLTATGTALKWYNVATGGTALATTASIFTGTYYVTQTVNGCESSRKAVTVAVNTTPPPTASSNQTFCNSGTIADLVATGTALKWYLYSSSSPEVSTTFPLSTGGDYYVTQTLNGCESVKTMVIATINVTPAPTALEYQIYAGTGTLADLTVTTGSGIKWYSASSGGAALPTNTAFSNGATYYASQTINGCEGIPRFAVTVKRISDPVQNFCGSATVANLVASTLPNQVANWYSSAISTVVLPSINALTTKNYYVEQAYPPYVSTLAGNNSGQLSYPRGVAADANGMVYISDSDNHRVLKITPAGVVTNLAGNVQGYADGDGIYAKFNSPVGIAVDASGNVFVADTGNHCIRKISQYGSVTTFAGSTTGLTGTTNATGTSARFNTPTGLTIDSAGNLYVVDNGNHRIRKITPAGVVTTLAGSTVGYLDATGTAAKFNYPNSIAVDNATGNLFVSENYNYAIRKITPAGVVTTFAGSGTVQGSVDGTGTDARFNSVAGLTVDATGTLYVTESSNNLIRKITSAGVVSYYAGSGPGYTYADGTATVAKFVLPTAIVADNFGHLYVTEIGYVRTIRKDTYSNRIPVSVTVNNPDGAAPTTTARTFCNTGYVSDLTATGTGTMQWYNVATGGSPLDPTTLLTTGTYYVTQTQNGCESSRTPAAITVNVTTPPTGFTNQIYTGSGTVANLSATGTDIKWYGWPTGSPVLAAATDLIDGNTYYASQTLNGCESSRDLVVRVKRIGNPDQTYCGSVMANGLYSTPTSEQSVRWYATSISTTPLTTEPLGTGTYFVEQGIAANEVKAYAGSTQGSGNGTGAGAQFNYPIGITTDSAGNAYVADSANDVIRKITPDGVTTTFSGVIASDGFVNGSASVAKFNSPTGVVTDAAGNLYVTDQLNNRIRKISIAGTASTFAGSGVAGSADGTGAAAQFNGPVALTIDINGNLYVADQLNHRIRKITPAGVVTTVAGSTLGYADGVGTAAQFNYPMGLAVDAFGNIYVADKENHRIRKVTPNGLVTTVAGSTAGFTNGNGTAAQFNSPSAIVIDSTGTLYVSDTNNHSIRKITSVGTVTTLAGNGSSGNSNGPAVGAQFNSTSGITIDKNGTLYVTDYNHLIRKLILETVSNRLGINVTVNPLPPAPTITANGPTTFCSGNNVVLTSSLGVSYLWSSGVISARNNPVYSSGSYTVRVGDANGCLSPASNPVVVTVNPIPQTPIISSNAPVCQGDTLNVIATNIALGRYLMNGNSGIPFIDISNTGASIGAISDDSETNITMPPFTFNGAVYTTARISPNGVIVLGADTGDISPVNSGLSGDVTGAGQTFLAPYWDDLNVTNTSEPASIKTQTIGDNFIIQYTMHNHYQFYGGTITFQVQLSLSSGIIHFVYQDVVFGDTAFDNGVSATVGIKMNSNNQVQYSYNSASLVNGQSITFLPVLPTYEWSVPSGALNYGQNQIIPGATSTDTGRYFLQVVDPYSGCRSIMTGIDALVKVTDPPVVAASQSFCPFVTVADLVVSGQGTINWYDVATGGTPLTSVTPLSTGTYYVTQYLNGCESLRVPVQVTINPITTSTINVSACGSYTWSVNNQTYTQSGTYTVTGANVYGCLDTKTLVLTINNNTATTQTVTACGSYTWVAGNGATYTQSGTYTYVNGCQTQTLVLTIGTGTSNTTTISSCDSYHWAVTNQTYTVSGTYTYVNGCETQILALTIVPRTTITTDIVVCNSYTWSVNGQTYTTSGTYTHENGCQTEILNLTLACASVVNLKLNIEGYYDSETHAMRPVLANQGIGSSSTDVDNVTVELRDGNGGLVSSTIAMLHTNGTVAATFNDAPNGLYYLVVKTRNAIETWSATQQPVNGTPLQYDFTNSISKAFGDNLKLLESGVYGLFSGDLNQDGYIDIFDFPMYDEANQSGGIYDGTYTVTDINGDGYIDIFDFPILDENNQNNIQAILPY